MSEAVISQEAQDRIAEAVDAAIKQGMVHEESNFYFSAGSIHARAKLISTDGSTRLFVNCRPDGLRIAPSRPMKERADIRSAMDLNNHVESLRRLSLTLERIENRLS